MLRAQLSIRINRPSGWQDRRRQGDPRMGGGHCGYDKETVQDVMLGAVEKRFGRGLPVEPLEWLTDNGSAYRAHERRAFARMLGLEPCTTAARSPESNGIAESFVKTIKRDYISIML